MQGKEKAESGIRRGVTSAFSISKVCYCIQPMCTLTLKLTRWNIVHCTCGRQSRSRRGSSCGRRRVYMMSIPFNADRMVWHGRLELS